MKDKSKIPKGGYCYDENGICPYWSIRFPPEINAKINDGEYKTYQEIEALNDSQSCGYCSFLDLWDWNEGTLLWDQCKECNINDDDDSLYILQ